MRRLLPPPAGDVAPEDVYRDAGRTAPPGRPWVMANMVASADGSTTVAGRSGGLGGPADRRVFALLRSLADVVVVGAGTVRAERYRPILGPRPTPVAVVSRSLDLDWGADLFTAATARTVVVTCEGASADRRSQAATVADVVVAGNDTVDPARAMVALAERGHRLALCEGGPSLLGDVVAAGVLDELCLTVSPMLAAGTGPRLLTGVELPAPQRLRLASALEDAGFLLLRYLASA